MIFCLKNGGFTKIITKKKATDLQNQGVSDKGINNVIVKSCKEHSFKKSLSWSDGQRIIELGVLADALRKYGVKGCSCMLNLRNTESKKRCGFASFL